MSAPLQRVFVVTAPAGGGLYPSFLVSRDSSDDYVARAVTRLFGTQPDGTGHLWEAYDEPCSAQS